MNKKVHLSLVFALIIVLVLSACGGDDDKKEETKRFDEVTVQLKWLHNPQFAGFYAADRLGYYTQERIRINLIPGGPNVDVITPVENGTAMFGIAGGDFVLRDIAQGNKPFKVIGATYQINPFVYVYLLGDEKEPLETADDWRGLRIAPFDDNVILAGILSTLGLTLDDVEVVTDAEFALGQFINGEMDVRGVFRTNEVLALEAEGYQIQVIKPEDYGVLTYPDLIYMNTDKVNDDLAKRFMKATLRGWEYVTQNPDKVLDLVLEYAPSSDKDITQRTWEASLPLFDASNGLLRLDENVMQSMVNLMVQTGMLTEAPDLDKLYTTEYLDQG
jgi:ABC-type nitrate/sulfonate/bicarbonate transport system substrate-binding protein